MCPACFPHDAGTLTARGAFVCTHCATYVGRRGFLQLLDEMIDIHRREARRLAALKRRFCRPPARKERER